MPMRVLNMIKDPLAPKGKHSGKFTQRSRALTAFVALLLISGADAPLISQPPASQLAAISTTLSLGESTRSIKLESDSSDIVYQNGFFINTEPNGHIIVRDKDGHVTGDFKLRPHETQKVLYFLNMHDAAIFKDGSIVASWIYVLPHDQRRYFYLVHYDRAGNFLEQIDLDKWRALRICIADDKSIWTLSEEEEFGHGLYSPDEGVLRNYKFGSGLLQAVVPRSNFWHDNSNGYAMGKTAIDCSGKKIHLLTGDGKWIEYAPGGDFKITKIEDLSHSTFGDFWLLTGFACIDEDHAYAVIHSVSGDPFRRMFAELLPSGDDKMRWAEVPPDKTLPATKQPPDPATVPGDKLKEPIVMTGVLGVDHEDGEQLVYRTSADEFVHWSKPVFSSSGAR